MSLPSPPGNSGIDSTNSNGLSVVESLSSLFTFNQIIESEIQLGNKFASVK